MRTNVHPAADLQRRSDLATSLKYGAKATSPPTAEGTYAENIDFARSRSNAEADQSDTGSECIAAEGGRDRHDGYVRRIRCDGGRVDAGASADIVVSVRQEFYQAVSAAYDASPSSPIRSTIVTFS